jgi:hypothetical protein
VVHGEDTDAHTIDQHRHTGDPTSTLRWSLRRRWPVMNGLAIENPVGEGAGFFKVEGS